LEGASTPAATPPAVRQTVQFPASAAGTKSLLEFEAISQHVSPSFRFAGNLNILFNFLARFKAPKVTSLL